MACAFLMVAAEAQAGPRISVYFGSPGYCNYNYGYGYNYGYPYYRGAPVVYYSTVPRVYYAPRAVYYSSPRYYAPRRVYYRGRYCR